MIIFNKMMNQLFLEDTKDNYIYVGDINEDLYKIVDDGNFYFDSDLTKLNSNDPLPSWVYNGRNLEIRVADNTDPEFPLVTFFYRRVRAVYNNSETDEYWFTLDRAIEINGVEEWEYILGTPNINNDGSFAYDAMNNRISSVFDINSQNLIACEDVSLEEGKGLLIYDKEEVLLSGLYSVDISINDKLLVGSENSRARAELSAGDTIKIGSVTNIVKKVLNDANIEVEYSFPNNFITQNVFRISPEETDIESVVYDIYDFENGVGSENYKNLFSIRPDRKIYYKFNVEQIFGNLETDTSIDLGNSWVPNNDIYKLWINGVLINSYEYTIDNVNKKIVLLTTDNIRPTYNYYVYLKYDTSTQHGVLGNYANFRYLAFDTNFATDEEYLNNLYKFSYFDNFNENLSNQYIEINEDFLDLKRRILKSRNNQLSFTSVMGSTISQDEDLLIADDITEVIDNLYNFRLIRYIKEAGKFIIYTNCQIVNPATETVGDKTDTMNYSIMFKNKLVFKNRLFGDGDWGRFNPFGLKQVSNTNDYGG